MGGEYRFRPCERLRSSVDFARVRRFGKRFQTPHLWGSYARNQLPFYRLGLVVQKKFWHASVRNHIKRRLREWFRLNKGTFPLPPMDIVIVARPGAEKLSVNDMAKELKLIFVNRDNRTS